MYLKFNFFLEKFSYMKSNNNNNIVYEGINPSIFTKKTNTKYKLVPLKTLVNKIGGVRYLPPVSKEWKNNVYNYNSNTIINLPVYDLKVNSLIKGYFNLFFNNKFLQHKYISRKSKRKSFNKIFVSKAEIKHTNNKALITLYVYNRERLSLLKNIKNIQSFFLKTKIDLISRKWLDFLSSFGSQALSYFSKNIQDNLLLLLNYKTNHRNSYLKKVYFSPNLRFSKKVQQLFSKIRRLRLRLSLNKNKFETRFLYKLSKLLEKYYDKKVEFNIVNLKSIAYNSDIFTEVFKLKVKKEKTSPIYIMNSLLSKVVLPKVTGVIRRGKVEKQVDFSIVQNRYPNYNLNSLLKNLPVAGGSENNLGVYAHSFKDNLNKLLYNFYYKNILDNSDLNSNTSSLNKAYYKKLRDIIFENIKYKVLNGARIVVKGRLTKRYRADRAIYKLKWKGGLKNIDSSFKRLPTVMFRGYLDANVETSKLSSKRRIGSFGVKSWLSGK